jgi:hypothetical protein
VIAFLAWRDRVSEREVGRWKAIGQRLQRDSAEAANRIRRVDSVFTRDTITYTRRRDVYRDRVDSIQVTDTVTVREQVIIAAADTAIRACEAVVTSCQARVAVRDSLIAILGQQREADRRLFDARLRASRPLLTPYVEAGADPLHAWALTGRAGLEMRVLGPLRLTGALQYTAGQPHPTRALLGARFTF